MRISLGALAWLPASSSDQPGEKAGAILSKRPAGKLLCLALTFREA